MICFEQIEPTGRVIMVAKTDIISNRRKQIFKAAVRVIAEKGFHNATINEIAAEAGLGKGTIYQYIKKKEDLITLIAEQGILLMSEKIKEADLPSSTPKQKLQRIIDILLGLAQEHSMLAKTMAIEIERFRSEELLRIEEIFVENFLSAIKVDIENMLPDGGFSTEDTMILSNILLAMCFLWAHSELLRKQAGDISTYNRVLTDLFLFGLSRKNQESKNDKTC